MKLLVARRPLHAPHRFDGFDMPGAVTMSFGGDVYMFPFRLGTALIERMNDDPVVFVLTPGAYPRCSASIGWCPSMAPG